MIPLDRYVSDSSADMFHSVVTVSKKHFSKNVLLPLIHETRTDFYRVRWISIPVRGLLRLKH